MSGGHRPSIGLYCGRRRILRGWIGGAWIILRDRLSLSAGASSCRMTHDLTDITQNFYSMKIRIRYFLLALLLSMLVGYAFGCLWPLVSVMYPLSECPVDKGTNLGNFISIFSTVFTFLAVVVALFKDEIMWNFKRSDVRAETLCDTVEEFLNEAQGDRDPSVAKYYNNLVLKNMGNYNAQDCELSVDSLSFQGKSDLRPMPINCQRKTLLLDGGIMWQRIKGNML